MTFIIYFVLYNYAFFYLSSQNLTAFLFKYCLYFTIENENADKCLPQLSPILYFTKVPKIQLKSRGTNMEHGKKSCPNCADTQSKNEPLENKDSCPIFCRVRTQSADAGKWIWPSLNRPKLTLHQAQCLVSYLTFFFKANHYSACNHYRCLQPKA